MKVAAASWNQFDVTDFAVTADVVGRKHRFVFRGKTVEIALPKDTDAVKPPIGMERIRTVAWTRTASEKIPTIYEIYDVDVFMLLDKELTIPKKLLESQPKHPEFTTQNKAKYLDDLTDLHEGLSAQAFDYWIRVLRWQTKSSSIGMPTVSKQRYVGSTYLIDLKTCHRFWAGSMHIIGKIPTGMTLTVWNEIQRVLRTGKEPPIWFEFLFDAQHKLRTEDYNGAILSAAIACESTIRSMFARQIPEFPNLDSSVTHLINQINIRAVLGRLKKFSLWNSDLEKETDMSKLHSLFNLRNNLMHLGNSNHVTDENCQKHVAAARRFIICADKYIK